MAGLAIALAVAVASAHAEGPPASSSGELSTVTLIDVSRLPSELIDDVQPGAEDGLVFLFLIVKQPGAEGIPTVREMRDFEIDRVSYRKSTTEKLGAIVEPVTFLEDANDFLARVTPGAEVDRIVPNGEAYVVVTTIGGARLPERGTGALQVEVGWGGKTEVVSFTFAVPPEIAPDAPHVPAVPGEPARPRSQARGILT